MEGMLVILIDIFLPGNMEPYRRVYTPTHVPCPSSETCTIRLQNHFPHTDSVSPCLTFHSDIFTTIGGISASPHKYGRTSPERYVGGINQNKRDEASYRGGEYTVTAGRVGKRLVKDVFYPLSHSFKAKKERTTDTSNRKAQRQCIASQIGMEGKN